MTRVLMTLLLLVFGTGCGSEPPSRARISGATGLDRLHQALGGLVVGQPREGYPNHDEQLMLVAINRARADPNNVGLGTAGACPQAGSASRDPQPPLMWNFDGARAARFHAMHLGRNGGGLSHDAFCDLRPDIGWNGCEGQASCSCAFRSGCFSCESLGGCGTDPFVRGRLFGFPSKNEVLAANQRDGWEANRAWITECIGEDGHRLILSSDGQDSIGLGFFAGGSCWQRYYGANGAALGITPAVLPAGVHRDLGDTLAYFVNYFEPAGAPRSLDLVLDGACTSMTREIGTATNATYRVDLPDDGACHSTWFLARGPDGARHTWPEIGAFHSGACDGYLAEAPPADCERCTDGETTACGLGRCAGVATCTANTFGACDAAAPMAESCNGEDDDCDGVLPTEEYDHDGDGFMACENDCDDHDPDVSPQAIERCNRIDDDCDGSTDEGCDPPPPDADAGTTRDAGAPSPPVRGCSCAAGAPSSSGAHFLILLCWPLLRRRVRQCEVNP